MPIQHHFVIDAKHSGLLFLVEYKEALSHYQERQTAKAADPAPPQASAPERQRKLTAKR